MSKKNNNIIHYIIIQLRQTVSSVQAIFLAMALYPEVQKKAQAEIDAVIGPDRLPDFQDRPSLPYINAVVKESMRWHLVTPLGGLFFSIKVYYHFNEFSRCCPYGYQ